MNMELSMLWFAYACVLALLAPTASGKIVKHTFHVGNLTVQPLCKEQVIVAVNGQLPGPVLRVRDGDTVVVHVKNKSPYNITIHWHGVFQLFSCWADGPGYVTQCPIQPGNGYTYRFNITGQEGTLWWHAHVSFLRATVHGTILIRPRAGRSYPFPKPHREFPIVLGDWFDANVVDVEHEGIQTGAAFNDSDAFTINGRPGDLYPCAKKHTYKIKVSQGNTYMLRMVNAALNNQLFFKVAHHNLTVVAVDASYTEPFVTDVIVIAPGQTVDVLLVANQTADRYYMAAHPYYTNPISFDNTSTTAILEYVNSNSSSTPQMPVLPPFNDTPTAHHFYSNLTGLMSQARRVPLHVDEQMLITVGLGLMPCGANATCQGLFGKRFAASLNNVSFEAPSALSMLEAHFFNVSGIFTQDFPDNPSLGVDFNWLSPNLSTALWTTVRGTRAKRLKYNSTVEIVLQNTAIVGADSHPIHLHGFDVFVLAQGFGNFNRTRDEQLFNLVNPHKRSTVAVPSGGWAVIRFTANNPGVWFMHCHLESHVPWGLANAFVVENGPTPSTALPPPPPDLPRC